MNKNLIFKEWKEKLWVLIFSIILLALFAAAALAFAGRREFIDSIALGAQMFFLPLAGLLLGASAFSSEFKDGSWAYLFSRPIRKSAIWISKFVALTALLTGITLLTFLILPLVPGLKERFAEFSLWGPSVLIAFGLFIISYSLSFLTDKQFLVVFFTLFIPAVLYFILLGLSQNLPIAVRVVELTNSFLALFLILVVYCIFAAASLYAFCRVDFSRPKSVASGYLKGFALFLLAGAVLGTAVYKINEGRAWSKYIYITPDQTDAVIHSYRGIFIYDSAQDRIIKLKGRTRNYMGYGTALGGGKITWMEESLTGTQRAPKLVQSIWIMDKDGRNKRNILALSDKPNSPIQGLEFSRISLSPDGRTLVLFAYPPFGRQKSALIWTMNSDGSGLRALPSPNDSEASYMLDRGWTPDHRHILIWVSKRPVAKSGSNKTEYRNPNTYLVSIDTGEWRRLPEDLMGIHLFGLSPNEDSLGYLGKVSAEAGAVLVQLRLLDLKTMATSEIISAPGIQRAFWNLQGDKIAFLAEGNRRIGIVSVSEKKILAERPFGPTTSDQMSWRVVWTGDGRHLVMSDFDNSSYFLRIFDSALRDEKQIPLSEDVVPVSNVPHLIPVGNKILVIEVQTSRLWSFDPATEKWKKLF